MSKKHSNFKSSIRDWYIRAFPSDQLGYRINPLATFDGSPVHMSVPVEVDGEKVWTCGYDFCWGETVAPDFSRARGRFPDATVAAWAAERSVNGSDVNLGIKERML